MRPTFQLFVVLTAALGLGIGAAFAGGAWYSQRNAPAAPAGQSAAGGTTTASVVPTGAGTPGAAGGAAGGGPSGGATPTTGVVEEITGDMVMVRTQAGGVVTVKLQPDTRLSQLAPASAAAIQPGQTLVVLGQP